MSVDFKSLLSKPADHVKAPQPLPAGTYHGMIKSFEFKESKEKKTPYVQFSLVLNSAGEDIDPSDLTDVDLSKKSLRKDFYLTDDSAYRLKEFTDSCNIPAKGRSLGELIQDCVGQAVLVEVTQRLNPKDPTAPAFNDVNTLKGQG